MFQVGDFIIYGGEGACQVEAVGPLELEGFEGDKPYYTLAPLYRAGKIYTPVNTNVYMRPVLSRAEAEALVRQIPSIKAAPCAVRNPRVLGEFYQEMLRSHDCESMVLLIKTAYGKSQRRLARGAKPSQVDERYLKRAEDLLYGELAVALDIPREEVVSYIAQAVVNEG